MNQDIRPQRAIQILAKENQIKRIDASTYKVKSQSGHGSYLVIKVGDEWKCECPDYMNRGVTCKHIYSILFSLSLRNHVSSEGLGFTIPEKPENCIYCGSTAVVRRGLRKNQRGKTQRFWCKDCGKRFVLNDGFSKMRNDPKIITIALDAYFKG
ncbi:MAG: IS1 family transposase [archaeon]|nr:IS1 family transposase [archaeon]MCP8314464.1 IS1 family transposase [archaeon]MCP8317521.1 IS1 family transposase [archaeon]MCP8320746.1 IS1 family transposase [archaeon]